MNQYSNNIRSNMQLFVGTLAGVTLAFAMGLVTAQERSSEQIAEEAAAMAENRQAITHGPDGMAYRPASDTTWFADAKFGLFVQWGISAIPSGVWRGDNYFGITEWIWKRSEADVETYKALAKQFNPKAFDAREWAGLAHDAGARYMVAAAKHHDGFALFDSKVSDFDIVDGTPFGRDAMAELAEAGQRRRHSAARCASGPPQHRRRVVHERCRTGSCGH